MAAQCFKCKSPLDGDFGMITCQQCGEINFLDESPGDPAPTPAPAAVPAANTASGSGGISIPSASIEVPGNDYQAPFSAPVDNFPTPLDTQIPAGAAPPPAEPIELSSPEAPEFPPPAGEPPTPEEAIKEIADFGNQPVSNTASGLLFYDVQISRIDTLELRKALLEALKDNRFKWKTEDLEKKIHNGVLILHKLSPVKASVLVKKIRHLDVRVVWAQGNIYEAPPSP